MATLEFAEEIEKMRSAAKDAADPTSGLEPGLDPNFVRADGYFSFDRGPE